MIQTENASKNSVFWEVIKGGGGLSGADSSAKETFHLHRQNHQVSKAMLLLMKPKVCKNNSPYERGPRNGNNCRENGYQLQMIKDTSMNLCQKEKKKLAIRPRMGKSEGKASFQHSL